MLVQQAKLKQETDPIVLDYCNLTKKQIEEVFSEEHMALTMISASDLAAITEDTYECGKSQFNLILESAQTPWGLTTENDNAEYFSPEKAKEAGAKNKAPDAQIIN